MEYHLQLEKGRESHCDILDNISMDTTGRYKLELKGGYFKYE